MYYPEKYAGTADCVGVYEGKETIIDFKQSNKPKKAEYIELMVFTNCSLFFGT